LNEKVTKMLNLIADALMTITGMAPAPRTRQRGR
jgi:hypothetical protein